MHKGALGQVIFRVRFSPVSIIPPLLTMVHISSAGSTIGQLVAAVQMHSVVSPQRHKQHACMHTYIHMYISWFQKVVRLIIGCGISHKVQNIHTQMSTI
jgi:Ser-tRNA(Ala) deacylase AlaX